MTSAERQLIFAIGRAARRLRLDEDLSKKVDDFRGDVEKLIADVVDEAMAAKVIGLALVFHKDHQLTENPTTDLRDWLASEDVRVTAATVL